MRKLLVVLLFALTGAISFAPEASAQLRPWEISIVGGPSFATGDFDAVANTGYHVQGSVGFDMPLLPLGLRLDALWQELPHENDGWYRQIGALANGVFELPAPLIRPYGLVGVGFIRTEAPEPPTGDRESSTDFGLNAGIGIEFPFVGLSGIVEARYLNIVGGGDFSSVPVSIGIKF